MGYVSLFLLALAVSMDAFTVAVCKGLAMKQVTMYKAILVGAYFGIFQAGMPLLGYFIGKQSAQYISMVDHWVSFFLLVAIGANMLKNASSEEDESEDASLCIKDMLVLSIATSIDALAVGVVFAMIEVNIVTAIMEIGLVTFVASTIGVNIGNYIGLKFKKYAEIVAGMALIVLGIKMLLDGIDFFALF